MICEIHIPLLGMNMKEATIVNWLVENGGQAEKDYALVEILETDKAVHEIVSPASGVLKVVREKGTIIAVGGLIGLVGPTMEACETALAQIEPSDSPETEGSVAPAPPITAPSPTIAKGGPIRISGIARKMAETHGIDLSRIQPSDPGGRISKEDVERAIQALEKSKAMAPAAAGLQSSLKTREKLLSRGRREPWRSGSRRAFRSWRR